MFRRGLLLATLLASPALCLRAPAPAPPSTERPLSPLILDPGHGGDDHGAKGGGLLEKDLVLDVARSVRERLAGRAPVVLTRDEDSFVALDRRMVSSMDLGGAAFVSLHADQVKNRKVSGVVVYTFGPERRRKWRPLKYKGQVPPMPSPPAVVVRESEALAAALTKSLRDAGLTVTRRRADYYVLKNPSQPSVLVELGYLTNPAEAARLGDPAHRRRLVEALASALDAYAAARDLHRGLAAAAAAASPSL